MASVLLAYIAGMVSILSPCVLPLLPIIITSALNEHKRGPFYLIAGLVVSFTAFGIFISTIGFSIGITTTLLQNIAASLMVGFGLILTINPLYRWFSATMSSLTSSLNNHAMQKDFKGLWGQFGLGFILGAVWSPCVGPTLGAAISLAAQGQQIGYASLIMFTFAVGIATPILIMSLASQQAMMRMKTRMMQASGGLKTIMGLIFIAVGAMILTGLMTAFEVWMLESMPSELIDFIYKF